MWYNMLKSLYGFNKLYILYIISMLICALFFTYYSINDTAGILKKSFNGGYSKAGSEAVSKTGSNSNKTKFSGNKLAYSESEEIINKEIFTEARSDHFEKKWMLYYSYLSAILFFSIIILYVKGWFIKESLLGFQFYQVHYIHLKDGKKDALSYLYSI